MINIIINMLIIKMIKDKQIINKRIMLLIIFLVAGVFNSFAQLSDLHYLPPLKQVIQAGGPFSSQAIYLSTPETNPFVVDVYQGTNATKITSITISKTSSGLYNLAVGGDNDITLLTPAKTGYVQSTAGLRFVSPSGKKFYVNWRGKSGSQASSLTSKGRAALGTAFKWGGVPNKGTNYSWLNASVGIMATADNTTVRIFGYNPSCTFRLGTNATGITDDALTITLNAGQTYVLEATIPGANSPNIDGWLGASISSDKDIAVNIGEMHYQPSVVANQDCGIDQIIPENTLGREYVFVRGNGVNNLEFPVVIATQNNTEIYVNGSATPITTLNIGQYYSIPSTYYSQNSTSASVPGANMYVRATKEVYAFQSLSGSSGTETGDINFIAPVNWLLSNKVDNIPNITNMVGTTINGGITIIASTAVADADIVVNYGTGGTSTVATATLTAAKRPVAGTAEWKTFYLPGLTGDISVNATGSIAVGFFGFSGVAGASGYFSGFETIPTIDVQKVGDGCLPSTVLTATAGFPSYQWKKSGIAIDGATSNTYTPTSAGSFTVVVSNGVSFYESATQSVYDCNPEIIVTTTVDKDSLISGETAIFRVAVKYLGFDKVTNMVVNNLLPAHLTYVSNTRTAGTVSGSGSNYSWNIGTMYNDEERVLTVTTTANSVASLTKETYTVSKTQTLTGVETNKALDDFTEDVTIYGACNQSIAGTLTGSTAVCEGINSTVLSTSGYIGTLQWQVSTNNVTFIDISGATSSSYTAKNLNSTTYYRVKATFGSCINYSTSVSITINPLPVMAAISGPNTVNPAVLTTYSHATNGGIWSSSNPSIATINASGQVFGFIDGSAIITYTYTNGNGCTNSVSKTISIVQRSTLSKTGQLIKVKTLVTSRNGAKGYGVGRSKNGELIKVPNTPVVSTGLASVSGNTSTIISRLNALGALTVSEMGVCYGTNALPTISDTKITSTVALGNFTTAISGLSFNTTYYARAYATNALGTTYGNQVSFISTAADGLTAGGAAASAYAIKQAYPNATDGVYWIKNPNINGGTPIQIYADMTTDGGGWTLILCNAGYLGWTYANTISRNTGSPSISANYSIVGWADYIKKSATGFQYMLDAQSRGSYGGIWTVNNNISFTSSSNLSTILSGAITRNTKFGTWPETDDGNNLGPRMPYYVNDPGHAFLTTDADNNGTWWGALTTQQSNWGTAPWNSTGGVSNPTYIWYWVR
jgi:uncharacterized repeat protein (TIGR01451 family)